MLWNSCAQYASKFGKLSSGHRTGKGQFSFQSQRKTISKNVQSESEVTQLFPTLCDSMDCSPPGSSVHGIFQAGLLEWVAFSFSRGSSWATDRTRVSRIVGRCFTIWATREAHQKHRRVVVSFRRMSVEIFYRWNLLPRSQLAYYMHSWRQEAAKKGPSGKYLGYTIRSSYSVSVDLKWSSSTVK